MQNCQEGTAEVQERETSTLDQDGGRKYGEK